MATISYNIISGAAPFIAKLTPSSIPENQHLTTGTFSFLNVPNGGYTLIISDSNGCTFQQELTLNGTDFTILPPVYNGSLIIVGNTNDENLIFDVNGTNRDAHYEGYPNPNTSTLYLWLKTLDGKPLTTPKTINYRFSLEDGSSATKFTFIDLSDWVHTSIVQSIVGPAGNINGILTLGAGFIETFFRYTYLKDPSAPEYNLELFSTGTWLYTDIPKTDGTNPYGVGYIDNDNVIMTF